MMRIKEAIQRRKLIQQLNDEYLASQIESDPHSFAHGSAKQSCTIGWAGGSLQPLASDDDQLSEARKGTEFDLVQNHEAYIHLVQFVSEFNGKLTDGHRRALRVTWNRLSDPPKTSGRGVLKITEKILDQAIEKNPGIKHCFYRAAFVKCLDDRKRKRTETGTIVTVRDHAHLLIELIDGILCILFDIPIKKPVCWDPVAIGKAHARLIPYGFDKEFWHSLGEIFAEVMFCQDCVRAYPLAASAWSMLAVTLTDKMFRFTKLPIKKPSKEGSGESGWSQQSSLANDPALVSLSADLQRKAIISLRGTGQPGSTASSFRRSRENMAQNQQKQQKRKECTTARKESAAAKGAQSKPVAAANSVEKQHKNKRPLLKNAPSFFSRSVCSLSGGTTTKKSVGQQPQANSVINDGGGGRENGKRRNIDGMSAVRVPVHRHQHNHPQRARSGTVRRATNKTSSSMARESSGKDKTDAGTPMPDDSR